MPYVVVISQCRLCRKDASCTLCRVSGDDGKMCYDMVCTPCRREKLSSMPKAASESPAVAEQTDDEIRKPRKQRKTVTEPLRELVIRLGTAKKRNVEIARAVDLSPGTISRILKDAGVE
jgi:hypothetical protein